MKTLILQFARLGDLYLSWPVARAIKRLDPEGEVHFLVRPRFKAALNGVGCVDRVWTLPMEELVGPLLESEMGLEKSLNRLEDFYDELIAEKYDRIINLSFSPASSLLTKAIAHPGTQVNGYTRHSDGYVHFSDEVSRYFWAQVGPGFPNRVHVLDLFSGVAHLDYVPEDFREPVGVDLRRRIPGRYFVLQVGASEKHKLLEASQFARLIQAYSSLDPDIRWVLVGAEEEKSAAQTIEAASPSGSVVNLVGQTRLEDLFGLIKNSEGLIGCDSVAMHMAPFVNQRAFCLSLGGTKFWETGPISAGSAVAVISAQGSFIPSVTATQIRNWTKGQFENVYQSLEGVPRFVGFSNSLDNDDFKWKLVQAIYMGGAFPVTADYEFYKGCLKLYETNAIAIQNLSRRDKIQRGTLTGLLDRVDEIFLAIVDRVPDLTPMLRWYQAEKTRIEPGSFEQIAQDTLVIHQVFSGLLKKYLLEEDVRKADHDGSL
jgi:heptosyltransferase-3